jgi:hypothetical protein
MAACGIALQYFRRLAQNYAALVAAGPRCSVLVIKPFFLRFGAPCRLTASSFIFACYFPLAAAGDVHSGWYAAQGYGDSFSRSWAVRKPI